MAAETDSRLPRLYCVSDMKEGGSVTLSESQTHYLRSVLRRAAGDSVRLFNGRDGEWRGTIDILGKKDAVIILQDQRIPQPLAQVETHLLFTPLKKDALDFLIEKAVELGVTHLHPVLTARTVVQRLNEERLRAQIIEAAEQSERLDVPHLAPLQTLAAALSDLPPHLKMIAALERLGLPLLSADHVRAKALAFLVGPEGGFTPDEAESLIGHSRAIPVSLGPGILRAETAVLACLAVRRLAAA